MVYNNFVFHTDLKYFISIIQFTCKFCQSSMAGYCLEINMGNMSTNFYKYLQKEMVDFVHLLYI